MRFRKAAVRLGLVLASLGVLALVFEILVRLFTATPALIRITDLDIGGRHRRGLIASIHVPESDRVVDLRFNSEDFRGPEWERRGDAGVPASPSLAQPVFYNDLGHLNELGQQLAADAIAIRLRAPDSSTSRFH
ncbi:MAG: hypothetical protein ABGY42_00485 [bacterium]